MRAVSSCVQCPPHTPLVLRPVAGSFARTVLPRCGVDFVQSARRVLVVVFLLRIDQLCIVCNTAISTFS